LLRKGIAEGLAILGSQPESCANCSQGRAEANCVLVIRELLTDADWVLWGSLNGLLPTLAEAAPGEFLDAVEKAIASDALSISMSFFPRKVTASLAIII